MKRPDKSIDDLENDLNEQLNKNNTYPFFFFDKEGHYCFFKPNLGKINITYITQGTLRISVNIV
jgi:hypothetical protein